MNGTESHYHKKQWKLRCLNLLGQKIVAQRALVDTMKSYLPALHIKLECIKIFVKAMNGVGKDSTI